MISPLLSKNIYLHVLDTVWERRYAHLGTLVRYADDFVVVCPTAKQCEEAERRVLDILNQLGLELHAGKTRRIDLSWGRHGFDFLGCHLRKRLSGLIWERKGRRVYFLQRHLRVGDSGRWTRDFFESLGLYRLRGTVKYPETPFWGRA